MTTATTLTLHILTMFGLYCMAAGLSGLARNDLWSRIMDGLSDSPALCYVTGIVVFVIGAAIVGMHNIWIDPLSIIVSFLGIAALVEGTILLARPAILIGFGQFILTRVNTRMLAIGAILLGAILFILGVTGKVDTQALIVEL